MPISSKPTLKAWYESVRDRALQLARAGDLIAARDLNEEAVELAAELGPEIEDAAFCNLAAVDIELGRGLGQLIIPLRQILIRQCHGETPRMASYNLARIYELRKEYKKGIFYARIACEHSDRLQRQEWISSSRNQLGNLLLAESCFEEATREFEQAMDQPTLEEFPRALILDNLGYCRLVQGRHRESFSLVYKSLRMIRRLGARHLEMYPRLTLTYAYLELNRLRPASRHGLRALRLADEYGDQDASKNAMFLMGEIYNQAGDGESAWRYFKTLQDRFYPEHNFLPDFLLAVDVRQLVNLKA